MMGIDFSDLSTAGGVLLGFQVTAFAWRVAHEAQVADEGKLSWIPPADYLNLLAMVVTALSVFVLPAVGTIAVESVARLLGFGALIFVGHSFALAGHYELFNPRTKRSYAYFPLQERIVLLVVAVISLGYLVLAFLA